MSSLPKILLVEDNPQILDIYTTLLESEGYYLTIATNVDQALEKAKAGDPDIIFLDIMLPGGKSGLDALKILRTDPAYGCTKKRIVLLTDMGLTDELKRITEAYADGFVVKAEIDSTDLIEKIKSLWAKQI